MPWQARHRNFSWPGQAVLNVLADDFEVLTCIYDSGRYDVCPKPGPSFFTNRFDMDDEAKPRYEQIDKTGSGASTSRYNILS